MPVPRHISPVFLELQHSSVHFDAEAFDAAIRMHGVDFVHWRGMRCPVGRIDAFDGRVVHEDHEGCSNGRIYTRAGVLRGLFTGNSKELRKATGGLLDASIAQCTFPRTYEDSDEEVFLLPGDRLYLGEESIVVPTIQTVKASLTGTDRLLRPVDRVIDLVDNTGQRFVQDIDFVVRAGMIVWVGRRPAHNPLTGAPGLYVARYMTRPYFYVDRLLHETRVAQSDTPEGLKTIRMPQSAMIVREYHHENTQINDPQATGGEASRQGTPPDAP